MASPNQSYDRLFSPSFLGPNPVIINQVIQIDGGLGRCNMLTSPPLSILNKTNFLLSPPSFSKPAKRTINPFVDGKDPERCLLPEASITDYKLNSVSKLQSKSIKEFEISNNSSFTTRSPKLSSSYLKPTIILQGNPLTIQSSEQTDCSTTTQTGSNEPMNYSNPIPAYLKDKAEALNKAFVQLEESIRENEKMSSVKLLKSKKIQVPVQSILDLEMKSDTEEALNEKECLEALDTNIYVSKKQELLVNSSRPKVKLSNWTELLALLSPPFKGSFECKNCHVKFETAQQYGGHKGGNKACNMKKNNEKTRVPITEDVLRKLVKKS